MRRASPSARSSAMLSPVSAVVLPCCRLYNARPVKQTDSVGGIYRLGAEFRDPPSVMPLGGSTCCPLGLTGLLGLDPLHLLQHFP